MTKLGKTGGSNVLIELPSLKHVMNVDWREHAACAKLSKKVFFDYNLVTVNSALKKEYMIEAVATCKKCPVQIQCYEFAVKNNEQYGIWAGTLPEQRKKLNQVFKKTGILKTLESL